jgi:hypothetical protein
MRHHPSTAFRLTAPLDKLGVTEETTHRVVVAREPRRKLRRYVVMFSSTVGNRSA